MSNPISRAIDTNLSSLRVTDRDVATIMDRIREEEKPRARKLKLRYAVVLAMLIALLTAGGTAAVLLSPRQIINEEVLPMAESAENGLWLSADQVREVLALARANELKLTQTSLDHIDNALFEYGGYWTEQLITDLMIARYGSMGDWPAEEISWYKETIANLEQAYATGRNRGPAEDELTREQAIGRAIELIQQTRDDSLDDPARHTIEAYFFDGLLEGGYPGYYWSVSFIPKVVDASMYCLCLNAKGDQLYDYKEYPGTFAAESCTDIQQAFQRIHGNMENWSQDVFRSFSEALQHAMDNHKTVTDECLLMAQMTYPDVAENAIDQQIAASAALDALTLSIGKDVYVDHAAYLGDTPNPIWKITIRQNRDVEGYARDWAYYVEIDSVTGEIKQIDESAAIFKRKYMYTLHNLYSSTVPDIPDEAYPSVSAETARMNAMIYLQERYGVTRDLSDPELFDVTVEEDLKYQFAYNEQWKVYFDARESGEVGYWAYVDGFGEIMASGVDNGAIILTGRSVDSIRMSFGSELLNYNGLEEFFSFIQAVRDHGDKADPVVQIMNNYYYPDWPSMHWTERSWELVGYIYETLGLKWVQLDDEARRDEPVLIAVPGDGGTRHIWKYPLRTCIGNLLVELDNDTLEIISVTEMENLYDPWYAPLLLQSDMEAAGIAPKPYVRPANNGLVVDEGTVRGLRLKHIYNRFCALYDPNPLNWSPAQLQSFQRAISESSSLGTDIGVGCMQETSYPHVPADAISPEAAAAAGAQALSLTNYTVDGSILIGDAPNPVWKVCYRTDSGYWYAEVDCLTGDVKTTAKRNDYQEGNNWFRDLTLEKVYLEHEATFDSISNG